jgi:hypothetical protein
MKWKITFLLLIFACKVALSFSERDSTKIKYSLGISPSAVLNLVPAIQLSHELTFTKVLSLGLETGFIFSHANINNENTRGYRIRPELKFTVLRSNDFSIDLFAFYNYRYYKATRVVELNKANFAYTEEIRGDRKTTLEGRGLGMDFGFTNVDSFIKKVNVGFGMGLGNITNIYSDEVFEPQFIFFSGFSTSGATEIPIAFFNISLYFL